MKESSNIYGATIFDLKIDPVMSSYCLLQCFWQERNMALLVWKNSGGIIMKALREVAL